ncbi:fatty acid cis/trans isomerase [Rheinheimera sp. UJ63]|uniref:fatty acid cis/trans isomerase n=1 Tax=Rheinheimera sp. UJ63 TaxID=2910157 RepID=UPI001F442FC6|nr:fatty acid cis/trans isomerase [Rheinheimera sp. UJ63]MCF4008534.1 fatty acid cis/trans isomerase [Rheinheimera sp. UJ63]
MKRTVFLSNKWRVLLVLCAIVAALYFADRASPLARGKAADSLTQPLISQDPELGAHYQQQIKPLLESRCVVCHACYDSPCQLNMSAPQGFARGAHKEKVYDGTRLLAATPNRLHLDAATTQEWRARGFFSVLENQQGDAPITTGLIAKMLQLKQAHPLPDANAMTEQFDLSLNRQQQCPTDSEFASYAKAQPYAGMPYALPGLNAQEHSLLTNWLSAGAYFPADAPLPAAHQAAVQQLEQWLNTDDLKTRLSARYIYEHLFTSHLYFSALHDDNERPQFFRLLRSKTPPGQAIEVIAGRRPYDDPAVERVYYRLQAVRDTIVNKTHQPYDINDNLLQKWQRWFKGADYQVSALPGYAPEVAANPLTAFKELPVNARYRFMLERAENTIMGYIKGPVCRGQVALNVINDRFWVYFIKPELAESAAVNAFYLSQQDNLRLPAEEESTTFAVSWVGFAARQGDYLQARSAFLNEHLQQSAYLTPDVLWDGDGQNQNASLTVFRHFDNATVVKGLLGEPPKTAWVIDYALLERIHYLLVAGFDVYGNYGHQLMTRLYMDFLRMEGESNFLAFLPEASRRQEFADWYQQAGPELTEFIKGDINPFSQPSGITFQTPDHKAELYQLFAEQLHAVQPQRYQLSDSQLNNNSLNLLSQLGQLQGTSATLLPELTIIMLEPADGRAAELFTLIRNSAHFNVSSLLKEEENRHPAADTTTLVSGILGSYPDAFWKISEAQLPKVVAQVQQMQTEQQYRQLLNDIGIGRHHPHFWQFSDKLNQLFQQRYPIDGSWLDYNRLEHRPLQQAQAD